MAETPEVPAATWTPTEENPGWPTCLMPPILQPHLQRLPNAFLHGESQPPMMPTPRGQPESWPVGPGMPMEVEPPGEFGDLSSLIADEGGLHTPAQLRPCSEWVPETPASSERPPPYDGGHSHRFQAGRKRCSGRGRRHLVVSHFARRQVMPRQTQPPEVARGGKGDFVEGGEELRQRRVATPLRALRHRASGGRLLREVGVQVNRRSLEGQGAQKPGRLRLQSIIKRSGAPLGEVEESTGGLTELQYPKVSRTSRGEAPRRAGGSRYKSALAQALNVAVQQELAALKTAWNIGVPGGEQRAEEAVVGCLQRIAGRAERACIARALRQDPAELEAMLPSPASCQVERLRTKCSRLEAEIAMADQRIKALGEAAEELSRRGTLEELGSRPYEELVELLASMQEAEMEPLETEERSEEVERAMQRLSLLELWLKQTHSQLEDLHRDLDDRESSIADAAASVSPYRRETDASKALFRLP